nr:DUF5691 domain-containing protein [Chloroflexota bacterium]
VYRQAGLRPMAVPESTPAPPERVPVCSPRAASLFAELLGQNRDKLLLEAMGNMRAAGLRLPFALLPTMLSLRGEKLRDALVPVLGQRGVWLAARNPDWRWVLDRTPPDDGAERAVQEAEWEVGTPARRLVALRRVRASAPERARAWVEDAWSGEKAEFRREMLGVLADALSKWDEPLLETALDDRSSTVRATAANLLARMPDAAHSIRMRERAGLVLRYDPPAEQPRGLRRLVSGLTRGGGRRLLHVAPPETLPKDWKRDGIQEKPPQGVGEREWWTRQLLNAVPLSHWNETLGANPSELVHAAAGNADWGVVVLEGWTGALSLGASVPWVNALWEYRRRKYDEAQREDERARALDPLTLLMACMPADQLEPRLREELVAASGKPIVERSPLGHDIHSDSMSWICQEGLRLIEKPWSVSLGETYLRSLRTFLAGARGVRSYSPGLWMGTLPAAAEALPPSCFDRALEPWDLPKTDDWMWLRDAARFQETVRLRKLIVEEIRA